MPIRVDLLALEPSIPGQACLAVKKWQGGHERLEFSIQRKDGFYLQERKEWSSNPFWFKVPHFSEGASGEALETVIGAEVLDPVLEGSGSSNFQIELREQNQGHSDRGVLRIGEGLLASSAGGETRGIYGATDLKATVQVLEIPDAPLLDLPEPVAEAVIAEPEPLAESVKAEREEPPVVVPAPKKKSNTLLMLIIGLLVLAIAGAASYFLLGKKPQTPDPVATPAPAVSAPAAAACTLESMSSQTELAFVQACIKQAPASADLLKIIETAKTNKHCGVAQRLYANRSQAGDVLIATAYAHEYDPKYHKASECFAEPDKATAAYWYETILGLQPDNVEARQRFEELKQ